MLAVTRDSTGSRHLKDCLPNHFATLSPAKQSWKVEVFLSLSVYLQGILKGYQQIWLKYGRQIAFGDDSDLGIQVLFPSNNKQHFPDDRFCAATTVHHPV